MDPLDFEQVAAELLRALRGRRSQVAFSRRLKYQSNVAYLWESQRSWPTAAVTLWAAERVGIDTAGAARAFTGASLPWLDGTPLTDAAGVARLLRELRGDTTILELAGRAERSRFAIARWLKGQAEPRLPDFLRFVEAATSRLLDFIEALVSPSKLPSVRGRWEQLTAARTMVWELPWSPAVLLMLQTTSYRRLRKHDDHWIADRLGIPTELVTKCLDVLASTGQIRRRGRRWEVTAVQTIDTRPDREAGRRLKAAWSDAGVEAIRRDQPGVFSFNVFSVSERDLARLEEMQRAHYRAMRAVIAASEPAERVVAANLHLFPIDGLPMPSEL